MPHISSAIASRVPKRSAVCQSSVICVMVPRRARGSTSSRRPTRCAARDCLVYIHGGYWQELSKDHFAFLAPAWHAAGFACAVVGYTLAPEARLPAIVSECREALTWLHARADVLDFDSRNMVVAGSSAGGYLAAACGDHSSIPLRGMVCVSGIYDVAPLIGTSINDALGLDAATAASLDLLTAGHQFCPAVVAWGEIQTSEFKRQSRAFAARLSAAGTPSTASRYLDAITST